MKQRPISTKGLNEHESRWRLLVLECLIFIGEEFRFRWRCYKLHGSSTNMYRALCIILSRLIGLISRLGLGLVDQAHQQRVGFSYYVTLVDQVFGIVDNTWYLSTNTWPQSISVGFWQFSNTVLFSVWIGSRFLFFSETVLIGLLKFVLDQDHPNSLYKPLGVSF